VGENSEIMIHAHVVVSDENCRAFGGHLMKDSHVGATAELMIVEGLGLNVQRGFDEKTKLNLLKLG
jgi:predicted DNA-binding protein with PD1-like motif